LGEAATNINSMTSTALKELQHELEKTIQGKVCFDLTTRLLFSTDASLYQIEPIGVVFPRTLDELAVVVEIAGSHDVPVLARGSGSSLAGQAIGNALIIDCSRHLNHILDLNPEEQVATVEPGVIMNELNKAAAMHRLQFGPDPASAERATMGGSIASNASGAHSILYGMTADHLISAEVILADGTLATFSEIDLVEAGRYRKQGSTLQANIYAAVLQIRDQYEPVIRKRWPRTWRRASGYNLNYLLPWTPNSPPEWQVTNSQSDLPYPPISPGKINLAPLLAGSEGTLAVIRRSTLRLVPLPRFTALGVLAYPSLDAACDAVPDLLDRKPSAIELIPRSLIRLARSVPAYAARLDFVDQLPGGGDPAALLIIEFSGEDPALLREHIQALRPDVLIAESKADQNKVWTVRKVGLGLLSSRPGDVKSAAFIEDIAVPVEKLSEFVREMERILEEHSIQGDFFAHASAGCLHIRPLINLKSAQGIAMMRSIAAQAAELTFRLGGSMSGEHGDGLSRSEWLEKLFGKEIYTAFRELKSAADPKNLLNPGKIVNPQPMDVNFRYGPTYHSRAWQPVMDFTREGVDPGAAGLARAIEMCNGAGVCRKIDGVMCPSFQATQNEMHSTRGRANLLRAMTTGKFPSRNIAEKTVYEALDLCLACKGCKSECPSAVDMAKLKYEFVNQYYDHHRRRLRDYLFGYIHILAQLGYRFAPFVNSLLHRSLMSQMGERWMGLSSQRSFPLLSRKSLRELAGPYSKQDGLPSRQGSDLEKVIFLSDAFTEYFYPNVGLAALHALISCGCQVTLLPVIGAGRTLISKGFLEAAKRHAARVLEVIEQVDPEGKQPVVGVEPSEIYTLRDEYTDLWPADRRASQLVDRAYMIDEFLIRPGKDDQPRIRKIISSAQMGSEQPSTSTPDTEKTREKHPVLLHGHCYQKAQPPMTDGFPTGVSATVTMLEAAGYPVKVIDSGCCGMAGAFGYEEEHYQISIQVGEMKLLPAVRSADSDTIIAASGVSCQSQIEDGSGRKPVHPITLIS
jgi:FAD/FMN-containing dehydrogenase/Fe-S oxidoreductase